MTSQSMGPNYGHRLYSEALDCVKLTPLQFLILTTQCNRSLNLADHTNEYTAVRFAARLTQAASCGLGLVAMQPFGGGSSTLE
jgi:hypothetical protein